jgi:hypothetical protein
MKHAGEKRNAYKILVRKPEGKRQHRRPRQRWEYNIIMDTGKIGWEGVDWMHLAQRGTMANSCEHENECLSGFHER